jgi:hypothetical protein
LAALTSFLARRPWIVTPVVAALVGLALVVPTDSSVGLTQLLHDDMRLRSEKRPHGTHADWASHPRVRAGTNPRAYTAFTTWGQLYECASGNPQPAARVEIRDIEGWIQSKSTGAWVRVQRSVGTGGGAYREDYANNDSHNADAKTLPGGATSAAAGGGYNYHFWPTDGRVSINPADIGAVVTTVRARLAPGTFSTTGRAPCYVISMGADYWRGLESQWNRFSTNKDVGIGRFKRVDGKWRLFTMSTPVSGGPLPTPTVGTRQELR